MVLSLKERETIAWHEAGHCVAGWFLKYSNPLLKISIIPRGKSALGYARYLPNDQHLMTEDELLDHMCMAFGGRISEILKFGQISTGAQDDLRKITKMAYAQILKWGMNARIGPVSFPARAFQNKIGKPYSETTAAAIDEEARFIIQKAYDRTFSLLKEKFSLLETVALKLLKTEVLTFSDVKEMLGERPYPSPHTPQKPRTNSKPQENTDVIIPNPTPIPNADAAPGIAS